jgi:ATP/maltotriose-dependent transcriptional regulator MalT
MLYGLTNQEIANQLYLSLRTVKFHTGNIYQKLRIKYRAQAIARARL